MDFSCLEITHKFVDPADFQISAKDRPHPFGLVVYDEELAVLQFVAKG